MPKFNVKTIPLSNGHTYVGHSDRGFASTGVEKDVPVGPGIVYKGKNILFAESFDDAGNASGAYIRIGENFTEVGLAKGNLRCGPVYRSGAEGGAYGTFAIYDGAGQPDGASITFSHTNARLDVYDGGELRKRCALFAADGVHLGITDGERTTVLPDSKNIPFSLPSLPFHALHIEAFSYAKGFSRENGGEALNGFGADLRNENDVRLGFFKNGKLDGIGIRRQPFRTVMGVFKNGTPVGGCLSIEKDKAYVSEYVTGFAKGVRVWMDTTPKKLFAGIDSYEDGYRASYTIDGGKDRAFRELRCKIEEGSYQYLTFDPSKGNAHVCEAGAPLELSNINHAHLTPREEAMLAEYEYRIDEVENDKDVAHREICLTRSHTTTNNVSIPKIAKTLGPECFKGNESLESLTVGGNIKFIGDDCFRDCKRLRYVTLEYGIDIIASGSFAGTSLREVVIPEGVLIIRTGAFADCYPLTDAYVPKDVKIADGAFPPHCKIHRGPKKVKPEKKKRSGPSLSERVGDGISAFFGAIGDFFKGLFKRGPKPSRSSYSGSSYSAPSRPEKSRPSRSRSYSSSSRTSSVPEIICTVVMILLVLLALSGVTNTVIHAIEDFVFSTYPEFYEFNLIRLAIDTFEEDPDVFFLLVPFVWLIRIILTLLSVPVQLIIYLLLAVGHVIIFVLGMGFNFVIIYAAAPAISIFLIVRAAKNKDPVGVIYLIVSVICTILYYIFSMVTVR